MQGRKFWVFATIFTILSAGTIWQVHELQDHVAFSDRKVGALSSALDKEQANAEKKGVVPVAPPATAIVKDPNIVAGPPGPVGPTGPQGNSGPGPSDAQVISATFMVLRSNPDLTVPQIKSAVSAYLRTNPPPAGVAGKDGKAGATGATGASGKDGANGINGTNGTDGKNGVGIANVSWSGCSVVLTLTDGSTSTSGPMCGPAGPSGPSGPAGKDGTDAVPFTFTFVVPGPNANDPLKNGTTYTCTITAPSTTADCKAS